MSGPDAADEAGRAAQERLSREARETASALLDWLGTRLDRGTAGEGAPPRPAQSAGPCTWCPVCALVAALRGEQPELTARLAEQASGLMALLRLVVQAHQDPGHAHHDAHHHAHHHAPPAADGHGPASPGPPPTPPGWPAEWGAWDAWGAASVAAEASPVTPEVPETPVATSRGAEPSTTAAGPGRRRPPARRASPRTAAFRGPGVPADGDGRVADGQRPGPTPQPVPVTSGRARPDPPVAGGPVRPSVQRIAIRRPARRDGVTGHDGDPSC